MISVFVSSTFVDLAAHREAVRDRLQQAGFRDVAMETLGSRDQRPADECVRLAANSDYFVGVYAHRYGHVPVGSDKSIVELEYEAAPESRRLIYLVRSEHPWNPKHIDGGEAKEKLAAFKTRLRENHVCKDFGTPDNLASVVVADLARSVRRDQMPSVSSGEGGKAAEWTECRHRLYEDRRFTELVHVLEPSESRNQKYDVSIYLFRHRPMGAGSPFGLTDISSAVFYLGAAWADKVFARSNDDPSRYLGIRVAAYGTFMCLCRVTFTDGTQVVLDRYIDFESGPPLRGGTTDTASVFPEEEE